MRGESASPRVKSLRSVSILALLVLGGVGFAGCTDDPDRLAEAKKLGCLEPHDIPDGHGWATVLVRRPEDTEKYGFMTLQAKPQLVAWRGVENTTDYVSETVLKTMDWMEPRAIWADVAIPVGSYQWIRITVEPGSVESTRVDGRSMPVSVQGDRISVEPGTDNGLFEMVEGRCLNIEVQSALIYENDVFIIR